MMTKLKRKLLPRLGDQASDSDVNVRKSGRLDWRRSGIRVSVECERLKRKEEFPLTCSRNLERFEVECSAWCECALVDVLEQT